MNNLLAHYGLIIITAIGVGGMVAIVALGVLSQWIKTRHPAEPLPQGRIVLRKDVPPKATADDVRSYPQRDEDDE